MKKRMEMVMAILLPALFFFSFVPNASAADSAKPQKGGETKCHLDFTLKGWSAFYMTAKGEGTISCDNGQNSGVSINAKGGGVTFGKSKITNGRGTFSAVKDIDELYGAYATSEAHAGVVGSAAAQAMTKGEVSLALHGTGKGVDIGIGFGSFKITPQR